MTDLPIQHILPQVILHLSQHTRLIVQAPPGAGKSTGLPLALLAELTEQDGQIWLLEPRRLAAQQVAHRLAQTLNEHVGRTIGLMTGENSQTSQHNRIVVMTEAILSQRLVNHNDIPQCHTLLFDEFHERNLHTDLGLALALQCQSYLREDLNIVIMSATLDTQELSEQLDCPIINSDGRSFDVAIEYLPLPAQASYGALAHQVAHAIQLALNNPEYGQGDVLVFLPGIKEIQECARVLSDTFIQALKESNLVIHPLHGQLNPEQQNKVLAATQKQTIILATDIAKTSLTLPKVTMVIDSGLERINQFNLRMGMDELVTIQASQASAIQRAGRAGRVQKGVCYRLYSEDNFQRRAPFSPHAIERSDLAPLAHTLAAWGSLDLEEYEFLTPPDTQGFRKSIELLQQLNILDHEHISEHGTVLSSLALHPRLSHMIVQAKALDMAYDACVLAAILTEGDPLFFDEQNADLSIRLQLFERTELPAYFEQAKVNQKKAQRIRQLAKKFAALLQIKTQTIHSTRTGLLLMLAYPDRIAQRRGKGYRLRNGLGCQLHHLEALPATEYLAVAHISQSQTQGQHNASVVRLASSITLENIENVFSQQLQSHVCLKVNDKQQLQQIKQTKLGELVLKESTSKAEASQQKTFYLQEFSTKGLDFLPLKDTHQTTLLRLRLAHQYFPDQFPSFDEATLICEQSTWLEPFMQTTQFTQIDYGQALMSRLEWHDQQLLHERFPLTYELPTGRQASIDYSEAVPVVRAKLQECFGLPESPRIAQGKITLNLHLLSPAQRPLAMTQDLAFFWQEAYPQVRKENRGRYAKHPWPENPLDAQASALTKRRLADQ